jgi:hypothetical protein
LTFRHYILYKYIPTPPELEQSYFSGLPLSYENYLLGVADLTYDKLREFNNRGELMRRAINNISNREGHVVAMEICSGLRQIQSFFQRIYVSNPGNMARGFPTELISKVEVLKTSVTKVEDACYNLRVRWSELPPEGWTIDVLDDRKRPDGEDESGTAKKRRIS